MGHVLTIVVGRSLTAAPTHPGLLATHRESGALNANEPPSALSFCQARSSGLPSRRQIDPLAVHTAPRNAAKRREGGGIRSVA